MLQFFRYLMTLRHGEIRVHFNVEYRMQLVPHPATAHIVGVADAFYCISYILDRVYNLGFDRIHHAKPHR